MDLAVQLLKDLDAPQLRRTDRILLRCRLARELQESGNYEAACSVLEEFWQGVSHYPSVSDLDDSVAAEILLICGSLTGWIGSSRQIPGAQERAKDLITESSYRFNELSEPLKVAECEIEIALCYWREGAMDEARITLQEAIKKLEGCEELKLRAELRLALVERTSDRPHEALKVLKRCADIAYRSSNSLAGRFHAEYASTLKNIGSAENDAEVLDQALVEFAAASYHFEKAGHNRYRARVENNLGLLYLTLRRPQDAHTHLDRARRIFQSLSDKGSIAQVDETIARVYIERGLYIEAEKSARASVQQLEAGDESSLLAESLITHAVSLCRLKKFTDGQRNLQKARSIAERVGDSSRAILAALVTLEEVKTLSKEEIVSFYIDLDSQLAVSRHTDLNLRLRKVARTVVERLGEVRRNSSGPEIIFVSDHMAETIRFAERVAPTKKPVLVTGETGTGKELLSRLIHDRSGRRGRFVAINCAALPDTLAESQLFGHRKGSFTDAYEDYPGAAREARDGTLFLDEIGDLSEINQAKLLRLVEYWEVCSVGSVCPEKVDVRIVAATNKDLAQLVSEGKFREDLYYRLNTFEIHILPLRERPEDIKRLADYFISEFNGLYGKEVYFTPDGMDALTSLQLRGNVRELRSLIEKSVLLARDGHKITAESVEVLSLRENSKGDLTSEWRGCNLSEEVNSFEGKLIEKALVSSKGSITAAARLLGISHQSLSFILKGRQKHLLNKGITCPQRKLSIIRDRN
jgi:transcriptional regulator with PAS, ATPase and Fis domain